MSSKRPASVGPSGRKQLTKCKAPAIPVLRVETNDERSSRLGLLVSPAPAYRVLLIIEVLDDGEVCQFFVRQSAFSEDEEIFMLQNPKVWYAEELCKDNEGNTAVIDAIVYKARHYRCLLVGDERCTPQKHHENLFSDNSGYNVANSVVVCVFIVNYNEV